MGVVPATAPSPKGPPAKQGGQPPVVQGGQPSAKKAKIPPKAGGNAPGVSTPTARRDSPPPSIPPTSGDGGRMADANEATWAQVVSRAAKKAAAKAAKTESAPPRPAPKSAKSANAPVTHASNKKGSGGKAGGTVRKGSSAARPQASGKKAPLPKLRSLSSAAIVITCADPTNYQEVVGKARSSISLKDVGIEDLRPRRAITGTLIWEVRGQECRAKACGEAVGRLCGTR
ncbi:PREDICTED: nascent polypeptide-associated complex subunit alpha, muscle-specific form-like [Acromyrmex echinatior]|uniref:nascent polypeptide-associated complex subunit alpha, muscle-specific form-like n=1 Tax=Acromyrmex echinatior TaxID=103372 RepID=UPI000580E74E|nr:PREDICTED: nascent polypeptide-associated complex subunit alpha, muscle-specific form-like [Acromyrmex echinatior]